jgi:hypothetical protein
MAVSLISLKGQAGLPDSKVDKVSCSWLASPQLFYTAKYVPDLNHIKSGGWKVLVFSEKEFKDEHRGDLAAAGLLI